MDRVCDDISGDVTDIQTCRDRCGSYNYMGFACPRAGAVECWCCNELDDNSAGASGLVSTSDCDNTYLHSGLNNNNNAHCSGYSGAEDGFFLEGFFMGGWCSHWRDCHFC